MIIGLLGMALLVIAWVPEILETIRKKGKGLDLRYLLLVIGGNALLFIYSIQIGDLLFTALNLILLSMALIELYYMVRRPQPSHDTRPEHLKKKG